MEAHKMDGAPHPIPKLTCDVMLGSLARWLRILGIDTRYDNRIGDDDLVRECVLDNRVALTRDRLLARRRLLRNRSLLVESEQLGAQLGEVFRYIGGTPDETRLLSRCPVCNSEIVRISRRTARPRVPAYVYLTHDAFKQCTTCLRVYWRGSHGEKIRLKLREWGLLESGAGAPQNEFTSDRQRGLFS